MDVVAGLRDRTRLILSGLSAQGTLSGDIDLDRFKVAPAAGPAGADLVINAGLVYGGHGAGGTRGLARILAEALRSDPLVATASAAGPGFVNLSLGDGALSAALAAVLADGGSYGRGPPRPPIRLVLAPASTPGPTRLGRARACAVAEALASVLAFAGHPVETGEAPSAGTDLARAPLRTVPTGDMRGAPRVVVREGADEGASSPQDAGTPADAVVTVAPCRLPPGRRNTGPGEGTWAEARARADEAALRFAMLSRRACQAMDLDPAAAGDASHAGPLFHVAYAHARARAVLRRAATALPDFDLAPQGLADADFTGLTHAGERALLRLVALFPDRVATAAAEREPQRLAAFLAELACAVHCQWKTSKDQPQLRFVNEEQRDLTKARLGLVTAAALVLRSGLGLLGVSAPDEMV